MSTDLYVAASAQITMQARMESIAQNIANMSTAGYRAEGIRFEAVMQEEGDATVAYSSAGETYITLDHGPISYTGNHLDVAIDGEGWFGLRTPEGLVYSRDGRMRMTEFGELQSVNGYQVVDPGGQPILVDPSGGAVSISEGGVISQADGQVGSIGLFMIPEEAVLTRYDNSAVVPSEPATLAVDPTVSSIRQGYVEGSNVNPILEMTKLIEVSRAYDGASSAIDNSDDSTREAIRTLGPS